MIESRKNLSTAIYVRVSTDEQAQEGFSVRGQTEKLKSYALLKDWDIYNIYNDEGTPYGGIPKKPAKPIVTAFAGFFCLGQQRTTHT